MRFAFCNEGFGDRAWSAVCAAIAEAGYDGVEIAPYTLAEKVQDIPSRERGDIRSLAQDTGLEIVGLHWLLVKPEGLHIGHPDQAVRARTRDYLCHLVDFCADVGGKLMVFGSPGQRGGTEGAAADDAWAWAAEVFRGVSPVLAEREITLCIEPLTPEETDFINTAAEARRLVEEVAHPNFRMILDAKAMCSEGTPIPDIIRANRDMLAHVHANDENRQGPGFGEVDFRPILAALRGIGYGGYISVEPFEFIPDVGVVARRSVRYLRECLPA
jgi:sugar phosphate isomerase/epimerase